MAGAIGEGLGTVVPVELVEVGNAPDRLAADVALLVVGGPTHALGMSRPKTRLEAARQAGGPVRSNSGIREWIEVLPPTASVPVVGFGTGLKRGWVPGSGPMAEGEPARARQWGVELGTPPAADVAS